MTNEEFAQNTADDLYNTGLSIENQITDEQVEAAAKAIADCHNPGMFEKYPENWRVEARAALVAAQGAAPQAESERESDKECPHTPRDEWRRRGYCHRCTVEAGWTLLSDQEARRELPVQPSSTVDEDALAEVIRRSYENEQGLKIRDDKRTARAVAEWLRGESR